MPTVPDTNTFSLQDVVDAISGTQDDLVECFSEANSTGFDPAYNDPAAQTLLEFRNYNDTPISYSVSATATTSRDRVTYAVTTSRTSSGPVTDFIIRIQNSNGDGLTTDTNASFTSAATSVSTDVTVFVLTSDDFSATVQIVIGGEVVASTNVFVDMGGFPPI